MHEQFELHSMGAAEMAADAEQRWDLSQSTGSLQDALAELTSAAPRRPAPRHDLDGRWVVDDIAGAEELERLGNVLASQDRPTAPSAHAASRESAARVRSEKAMKALEELQVAESVTRRERPAPDPRDEIERPADPRDAGPIGQRDVPSLVDRISTMPRFETDAQTAHPTGRHWVEPKKRTLLGRPPSDDLDRR